MLMSKSEQIYFVQENVLQGQHQIKQIVPVRFSIVRFVGIVTKNKFQKLLQIFLILITLLSVGLFLRWYPQFYYQLVYFKTTLKDSTHLLILDQQDSLSIQKKDIIDENIYFIFRFIRYQYLRDQNIFKVIEYHGKQDKKIFSPSIIIIPIIQFWSYLLLDLTSPFYVIQYITICIWLIEGYFYFAIVMISCSLIGTIFKYILLRKSLLKLQELANIKENILYSNKLSTFEYISSKELYPGDIIKLEKNVTIPADCQILSGEVLVNEATLTGEAIPVPRQDIIYEGTKVVYVKDCIAKVIRTSYYTVRGQYFRNVLFPRQVTQPFYKNACKFLLGLLFVCITAFLISLYVYIKLDYAEYLIVERFVASMTWVFPPALPIFFSITGSMALLRLKFKGIYSSNIDKIHSAGKVDTVCFDKTGTLTNLGMKVANTYITEDIFKAITATCHHLIKLDNQFVGDMLEQEMYKYSQAQYLEENTYLVEEQKWKVIKIFDFTSERQMMSVIVKSEEEYYIFAKGAPEKFEGINQEILKINTLKGFRVLAFGYRKLTEGFIIEQCEENLSFCGFMMFENQLKNDTKEVIKVLKESQLQLKIVSGDNPLTTIYCAQQSGIIDNCGQVILLDYNQTKGQQEIQIISGQSIAQNDIQLTDPLINPYSDYAITGSFFERCRGDKEKEEILKKTVIFSRIKPEQKRDIVAYFQKQGRSVAMIGDGSNDCSAIGQADIGISFSSTDASFTAPFSSISQSIGCVKEILLEGRSTTTILCEIFIYYVSLSFGSTIAQILMATEGKNYIDVQLIFLNFASNLPIMFSMTLSQSSGKLSKFIPDDNMFSRSNQLSTYIHIFSGIVGQTYYYDIFVYLQTNIMRIIVMTCHNSLLLNLIEKDYSIHVSSSMPQSSIQPQYYQSISPNHSKVYSAFIIFILIEPIYKQIFLFSLITISTIFLIFILSLQQFQKFLHIVDLDEEQSHFTWILLTIIMLNFFIDLLIQSILARYYPKIIQL